MSGRVGKAGIPIDSLICSRLMARTQGNFLPFRPCLCARQSLLTPLELCQH